MSARARGKLPMREGSSRDKNRPYENDDGDEEEELADYESDEEQDDEEVAGRDGEDEGDKYDAKYGWMAQPQSCGRRYRPDGTPVDVGPSQPSSSRAGELAGETVTSSIEAYASEEQIDQVADSLNNTKLSETQPGTPQRSTARSPAPSPSPFKRVGGISPAPVDEQIGARLEKLNLRK